MGGFAADVRGFADKYKLRVDEFARSLAMELAEEVVKATPVDTGFARASWYGGLSPEVSKQASAGNLSAMSLSFKTAPSGSTYYVLNNAAYIVRLEYGHSKQAPNGMVRTTLQRAPAIAEKLARRLAKS